MLVGLWMARAHPTVRGKNHENTGIIECESSLGLQEARARRPEGAKNVEHVGVMFRLVCGFMVVLRNVVTIERQTSN
jgi:hypothetical protein